MQIKLTNLPNEPPIVGFGPGYNYKNHPIYREIEKAREENNASYVFWGCSGNQDARASEYKITSRATRSLETDMIQSSLNPVCSKQNRSAHTKTTGLSGKTC